MKKVFYNNLIAKSILFDGYSVITLFCFVLCRCVKEQAKQYVINHECVHARQWTEISIASGAAIWVIVLFGASPLYFLICPLLFYILYGIEFLVRFVKAICSDNGNDKAWRAAYRSISFEQEAQKAEVDNNYLENSHYFAWHKYLYLKWN